MASKNKYTEMFQSPHLKNIGEASRSSIFAEVDWARRVLKKEDKVTWYCRFLKYFSYKNAINKNQDLTAKELLFVKNFEKNKVLEGDVSSIFGWELKTDLEHFFSYNLTKINEMEFKNDSWNSIREKLISIEKEWLDKNSKRSVKEYGKKVLAIDKNLAWFDLEKSGCQIEAASMGHCGNGYGKKWQRVYSLRSKDEYQEKHWIPHVTLIMNDERKGNTGEIKGYANEPPSEKYHDAIIEFLKSDLVTSMDGGGYKPENNFMLSCLSEEKQRSLYEKKSSLFSSYETWKLESKNITDDIMQKLENEYPDSVIANSIENNGTIRIVINKGDDAVDLAKEFELENLEYFAEKISDGFIDLDFCDIEGNYSFIEDELNKILKDDNNIKLIKPIIHKLKDEYSCEIEENEIDIETGKGLISLYKEEKPDKLNEMFLRMISDGEQSGVYDSIYKAYRDTIDNINANFANGGLEIDTADSEWSLALSPQDLFDFYEKAMSYADRNGEFLSINMIEAVKDYIFCEHQVEFDDIKVPYYGFDGFSEEVARESLLERLREIKAEIELSEIKTIEISETNPFENVISNQAINNFVNKKTPNSLSM